MQRHQALVAQAINREAVGLTLTKKISTQILAVVPFMAARAGEIELSVAHIVELLTFLEPWRHRPVDARVHRHAAGLEAHIGGHRGQFGGAEFPWRSLHPLGTANVDLLLQVHRLLELFVPFGHRRADAFHALCRILMAACAGFAGRTVRLRPQLLALLNGEKSRIVEIVVLDRLGLFGADPVPRDDLREGKSLVRWLDAVTLPMRTLEAVLGQRNCGGARRDHEHNNCPERQTQIHECSSRAGRQQSILSSPGLTGQSSNHRPRLLDYSHMPTLITSRRWS